MERQFLIAQLPVLLQQRTAQHRFGRQTFCRPVALTPPGPGSRAIKPSRSRCSSSHCDIAFSSWPISVWRTDRICGLDGAFLAHCRLRRWQVLESVA